MLQGNGDNGGNVLQLSGTFAHRWCLGDLRLATGRCCAVPMFLLDMASGSELLCCSAQGRCFPGFGDDNAQVVEDFLKLRVDSCEMESHQLFHLCRQRATKGGATTRAASICLGVVSRVDPNCPSKLVRDGEVRLWNELVTLSLYAACRFGGKVAKAA